MKKMFEVKVDVTTTAWESAYVYVEAETAEEARKLFEDNPYDYDWDGWETHDSEVRDWDVDTVEYDKWMTESTERRADGSTFDEALDMVERLAEEEKEKSDGEKEIKGTG